MKFIIVIGAALALSGCGISQARMEAAERDDDASCRKLISERGQNPNDPALYGACRQSMQSYRRDRAIRDAG